MAVRIVVWPLDGVARALASLGVHLLDLPSVEPAVLPLGKDLVPLLRTTPRKILSPRIVTQADLFPRTLNGADTSAGFTRSVWYP